MDKFIASVLGLLIGFAIGYWLFQLIKPELVATNATTTPVTVTKPLTCEQKIDKLTKEYVAVQKECAPVATSTRG